MAKKKKTNNSVKDFTFETNKKYKFDWCIITKNNEVILDNRGKQLHLQYSPSQRKYRTPYLRTG